MIAARGPNSEHERRGTKARSTHDFHRTPIEAVQTLLVMEGPALRRYAVIAEMACGDGAIVLPLRAKGFNVVASDIVHRGCPMSTQRDFLKSGLPPRALHKPGQPRYNFGTGIAGLTNPPFDRDEEFILKACESCDYVAMLLRLRFLAGSHLIDETGAPTRARQGDPVWQRTRIPFARVILPNGRWPMMHRDGYLGPKTESSMMDMAWFIWERGHTGMPVIHREPRKSRQETRIAA